MIEDANTDIPNYIPGSLLPDPVPFTGMGDARDYVLDPYYTGVDEDGLPNMEGFVDMVETGVMAVPDLNKRIEKRGKRERAKKPNSEEVFREEEGVRITAAFLNADMTWNSQSLWNLPELEDRERLMASVEVGDVLTALISDDDGWADVTLFDAEGNVLPFSPCNDFDCLEFEKLLDMANDEWVISCVVREIVVYGGTCAPADPDTHWRSCQLYTEIYGRPTKIQEDEDEEEIERPPAFSEFDQARFETLDDLQMYVRDADFLRSDIERYVPGMILREKDYVKASSLIVGMVCSCRFLILSNHMVDETKSELGERLGLHVADKDSHFRVLDVFEDQGKTQILLLHLVDDSRWNLFKDEALDAYEEVIVGARALFKNAAHGEAALGFANGDWIEACSSPIGFDEQWAPYELEVNIEDNLKKVSELGWRNIAGSALYVVSERICKIFSQIDVRLDGGYDGALCWGYIDPEGGLTLRVLAPAGHEGEHIFSGDPIDDHLVALRMGAVEECLCVGIKDMNLDDYKKQIESLSAYEPGAELAETRKVWEIDPLRNSWYPDDVAVLMLSKGKEIERVWTRLLRIKDGRLEAMLLNEPNQDFGVHVGDTLQLGAVESENGRVFLVVEL